MMPPNQSPSTKREVILSAHDIKVAFGKNVVLENLDLDVYRGEILGFVGGSGTGKSVLMRAILRLMPRQSGVIRILGEDYDKVGEAKKVELDMRLGVLFQHGALRDYRFPLKFRTLFIGLIGVMIGTQVRPDMINELGGVAISLAALAVFVVLAHAGNYQIFRRLGGYSKATAYFAGTPGGLMESIAMGEEAGADIAILTMQQFLRIVLVISLLPCRSGSVLRSVARVA